MQILELVPALSMIPSGSIMPSINSGALPTESSVLSSSPSVDPSLIDSPSIAPIDAPSKSSVVSFSVIEPPSQSIFPSARPSTALIHSAVPSVTKKDGTSFIETPLSVDIGPSERPNVHPRQTSPVSSLHTLWPANSNWTSDISIISNTPSSICTKVNLDFSTAGDGTALKGGDFVKYEWFNQYGLTITAKPSNGGIAPGGYPRIFDTENKLEHGGDQRIRSPHRYCGSNGNPWVDNGDPGRGVKGRPFSPGENCEGRGNALIIQSGSWYSPFIDANPQGGVITFDFDPPVAYFEAISFLNLETDDNITVLTTDKHSTNRTISIDGFGRGAFQVVDVKEGNVTQLSVDITSIRAITNINFCVLDSLIISTKNTKAVSPLLSPSLSSRHLQGNHGKVFENEQYPACSTGLFGINNIKVISGNGKAVKFKFKHNSCPYIENFAMWFEHTVGEEGTLSCHHFANTRCNEFLENEFEAKCKHGSVTVHIAALDASLFSQFTSLGDIQCVDKSILMSAIKTRKCHWELYIPCNGKEYIGDDSNVEKQVDINTGSDSIAEISEDINEQAKLESNSQSSGKEFHGDCGVSLDSYIYRIPVNDCIIPDIESPIRITKQGHDSVTFTIHQIWNGCQAMNSGKSIGWVATDYVDLDNEIRCDTVLSMKCNDSVSYTARCDNGASVIDVYTFDESGSFSQANDGYLAPPLVCDILKPIDQTKVCHFRYLLQCSPVKCKRHRSRTYLKKLS